MHFDTFPPLPEEAAVMADAVGREESKIRLAGEGKENTVILATKCATELPLQWEPHRDILSKGCLRKRPVHSFTLQTLQPLRYSNFQA